MDFSIGVTDNVSAPAHKAASAMQAATVQAKVLESQMLSLEKQAVKASALGDVGKLLQLAGTHEKLSQGLSALQPKIKEEEGSFKLVESATNLAGGALEGLGAAAGAAAAVFAVTAGLALAFGDGLLEVYKHALEAKEEVELMTIQFNALGDGVTSGRQVVGMLDDLERQTGKSRKELAEYAREFESLGITDLGTLQESVKATAAAQVLGGNKGAEAYENVSKKIQSAIELGQKFKLPVKGAGSLFETGLGAKGFDAVALKMHTTATQLGAELKAGLDPKKATEFGDALRSAILDKGEKPLEETSKSVSALTTRIKDEWSHLFEEIDDGPIVQVLSTVANLLDKNTIEGEAFKTIITELMNTISHLVGAGDIANAQEGVDNILTNILNKLPEYKKEIEDIGQSVRGMLPTWKELKDDSDDFLTVLRAIASVMHVIAMAANAQEVVNNIISAPAHKAAAAMQAAQAAEAQAKVSGKREADEGQTRQPSGFSNTTTAASVQEGEEIIPKDEGQTRQPSGFSNTTTAAGHQEGGMVGPAPGEKFASVQEGEEIIPKDQVAAVEPLRDAAGAGASTVKSTSNQFSVDMGGVHVSGDGKAAMDLSLELIALALEQVSQAQGLGESQ